MDSKLKRIPLEMDTPSQSAAEKQPPSNSGAIPGVAPPTGPVDISTIRENVVAATRTIFDPEIPVNIHELGLIYGIDVEETGDVKIRMTLTSPACPAAGSLPPEVQNKTAAIPGVKSVKVEVVWDPPWTQDRMSEGAKLQLGLF